MARTSLITIPYWAQLLKLPPEDKYPYDMVLGWHEKYPELHGVYEDGDGVEQSVRIFWMAPNDKMVLCRRGGPPEGSPPGQYRVPPGSEECYPASIMLDLGDPRTVEALRARGWEG